MEDNLYSLALECNEVARQYQPEYGCTVHQLVGHFPPRWASDDGWLEGLTVRVWKPRPGQSDLLVLEAGPVEYGADLVEWLRRALAEGVAEDEDGWLGASPRQCAELLRLATHPLTTPFARQQLLIDLLPCLSSGRAAQLTADLAANIAELANAAPVARGWIPQHEQRLMHPAA
jgi:hypothetical protein